MSCYTFTHLYIILLYVIVAKKVDAKCPSLEDVKAHILATFPAFDVRSLFENDGDKKCEKTVKFEKGVTPCKTPTSYYPRPQRAHSYSKGFTPSRWVIIYHHQTRRIVVYRSETSMHYEQWCAPSITHVWFHYYTFHFSPTGQIVLLSNPTLRHHLQIRLLDTPPIRSRGSSISHLQLGLILHRPSESNRKLSSQGSPNPRRPTYSTKHFLMVSSWVFVQKERQMVRMGF